MKHHSTGQPVSPQVLEGLTPREHWPVNALMMPVSPVLPDVPRPFGPPTPVFSAPTLVPPIKGGTSEVRVAHRVSLLNFIPSR